MKITKQQLKQLKRHIRERRHILSEEHDECAKDDIDCQQEARAKHARDEEGRDAEYKVHEEQRPDVRQDSSGLMQPRYEPRKRSGKKFIKDEDEFDRVTQDITAPFEKAGELAGQAVGLPGRVARGTKRLKNKFSQGYRKGLTKEETNMTDKRFKDLIRAEIRAAVSEARRSKPKTRAEYYEEFPDPNVGTPTEEPLTGPAYAQQEKEDAFWDEERSGPDNAGADAAADKGAALAARAERLAGAEAERLAFDPSGRYSDERSAIALGAPEPSYPRRGKRSPITPDIMKVLNMSAGADPNDVRTAVRTLQTSLGQLGFNPGKADGKWGKNTRRALRKFQKSAGLRADGILGKNTFAAIQQAGPENLERRHAGVEAQVSGDPGLGQGHLERHEFGDEEAGFVVPPDAEEDPLHIATDTDTAGFPDWVSEPPGAPAAGESEYQLGEPWHQEPLTEPVSRKDTGRARGEMQFTPDLPDDIRDVAGMGGTAPRGKTSGLPGDADYVQSKDWPQATKDRMRKEWERRAEKTRGRKRAQEGDRIREGAQPKGDVLNEARDYFSRFVKDLKKDD